METPIRMHNPVGRKGEKESWKMHRNQHCFKISELSWSPEIIMHILYHMREWLLPIRLIYGGFLLQT